MQRLLIGHALLHLAQILQLLDRLDDHAVLVEHLLDLRGGRWGTTRLLLLLLSRRWWSVVLRGRSSRHLLLLLLLWLLHLRRRSRLEWLRHRWRLLAVHGGHGEGNATDFGGPLRLFASPQGNLWICLENFSSVDSREDTELGCRKTVHNGARPDQTSTGTRTIGARCEGTTGGRMLKNYLRGGRQRTFLRLCWLLLLVFTVKLCRKVLFRKIPGFLKI